MIRIIGTYVVVMLGVAWPVCLPGLDSAAPLRVLLIGNSYIYFNNLPAVLEAIAADAGADIEAVMPARGGATLSDHLADGQLDRLRDGRWDYVVIQEQSTLGMRMIEGRATVADPEFFLRHARRLASDVRAVGAEPQFLLTWKRRDARRGLPTLPPGDVVRFAEVEGAWSLGRASDQDSAQERPTIRYTVRPVIRDSLIELDVTMTFTGSSSGETRLVLPRDRFGVPDMHRFVADLEVAGGAGRLASTDTGLAQVIHAPDADVTVRYRVRYDSASVGFVAYGPSVSAEHYHFLGSQWMGRVGPEDAVRRFEVRVERGSVPGPLAGSFGLGPGQHFLEGTYEETEWSVIAGGAYREDRFDCEGRPVATLLRGRFEIADDSLFAMARKIVCGQRNVLDDHTQPFYSLIITERDRVRAGASFLNAFACFARADSDLDRLTGLLAHEMMHVWLPRKLRLVPGTDETVPPADFSWFHDIRYDWFHEGFTEHLSRVLQVRVGLASPAWFVEQLNDDLQRLAIHPYRTASAYALEAAAQAGHYTNWHQRLSYLRGAVLAARWDAAIRRASVGERDLVDAIRRLLVEAAADSARIARPRFEQVLEDFGAPARHDVTAYALRGLPIPVDSLAPGDDWALRYRSVPAFEPGFDVVVSANADTVRGVREDGLAYAAGVRNGMPIVRMENAWRWGDDWRPDAPLTIVVRDGGRERTLAFLAVRGETAVPYFVRRD